MVALDALDSWLNGSRLIEASAGTGKTFTIAALYVRLVLGHGGESAFERPLVPPEILVVTYRGRYQGARSHPAAFLRRR